MSNLIAYFLGLLVLILTVGLSEKMLSLEDKGFVSSYAWGKLKGREQDWVRKALKQ